MVISKNIYEVESQPDHYQLTALLLGLVGLSLSSFLFAIKTYHFKLKYISYSKLLVVFLYICSWAFIFTSIPIVLANNENYASCLAQNFTCDIFYPSTKILIYLWLIERVWIVKADRSPRLKNPLYIFHLLMLSPYIGIFISLTYFHLTIINNEGYCYIGIEFKTSVIIVIYDFVINLYLTVLFVVPILKVYSNKIIDHKKSKLKAVAWRTMIASAICLFASFANICALSILGLENGAICFIGCFFDVMINVITIHIVTNPKCFLFSFFFSSSSSLSPSSLSISSTSLQGTTRRNTTATLTTIFQSDSFDTKVGSLSSTTNGNKYYHHFDTKIESTSSTNGNKYHPNNGSSSSSSNSLSSSTTSTSFHDKKGKYKLKSKYVHLNRIEKNWQMETIHSSEPTPTSISFGESENQVDSNSNISSISLPSPTYHPLQNST
ncbi:unnamed protein product [Cunninghamella blakesleeana]